MNSPQNTPQNHVQDRVVLITGAAGGFGRLVAQRVAAMGGKVVISDVNTDELAVTAASITDAGGEVEAVTADVTSPADMAAKATAAVDRFGAIDVIVNNAGIMPLAMFADHEAAAAAWDRCIDINLKGVLHGISAVHDQMIQQGRGHVINISSIYGNYPVAGAAVYGATKAAVRFMTEALRQESQGKIKVTTIRPTGVPGTGLGDGIINPAAISGILGNQMDIFMDEIGQLMSEDPPAHMINPDSIGYASLSPELLADQIVYAINQPWGVSISDITVRASGDRYMI